VVTSWIVFGNSIREAQAETISPGVWCDRSARISVSHEHEERLVLSLRRITGFSDLTFETDGSLNVGDTSTVAGGAAGARQLLDRVLRSGLVFLIEECSGSDSVNFGQAVQDTVYVDREGRILLIWRVRIDFEDFEQMQASPEVRSSFDEGFTLLHECLHGLGCRDAFRKEEIGECEAVLNESRAELGLPLRDRYFGVPWRMTDKITSVQLRFRSESRVANHIRRELHYLYFLLKGTCGSSAKDQ
jgi:hypothetical protein